MAVAIILTIAAFTISFQEICGQTNLANGGNTQNNMNQGFQTNSAKSAVDLTQNTGNLATNINSQLQTNLPQALSSLAMPPLFSLQPQQGIQPLLNQPQVAFQQPYQQLNSGQSFLQQSLLPSSSVIQQNPSQQANGFVPAFNHFSYSQQLPISGHLVNVPSLSISNPASIVSAYTAMPNCACTQTGFMPNTANTYLSQVSSIPITERPQVITSYSTLPYTSVLSSNPSSFANNAILPYQNQIIGLLNNPLIEDKFAIDEHELQDPENINELILSLLQTPKHSSRVLPFPYNSLQGQKGTKSSQLKSLLPVIFNLLKEKKERCSCDNSCKCRRRNRKGSEPQISSGYSKKKEYGSLREGMFKNNSEESQRKVNDYKRFNKFRKTIDESNESSEYEDFFEDDN
ncbi:hypothetical protein KGM_213938 [Danaus plexippus plexippus]|uniref:Uncharacterized protein n=1 Tax=Danaus plexippus plexippus TaxID=278856 RepID=A0A212F7K3_DANPL|nr:hypothetical protein KGM_213938 [Danaus plexippus plexippus]